jgi:hypothetical protein
LPLNSPAKPHCHEIRIWPHIRALRRSPDCAACRQLGSAEVLEDPLGIAGGARLCTLNIYAQMPSSLRGYVNWAGKGHDRRSVRAA